MSDHAKMKKMLEILMLLSGNLRYSIDEIAERFEISKRSVYRYIETFRNTGFVLEKRDGYFSINRTTSMAKEISELLHFSEEEAYILSKAIHSVDDNNLIKDNLIKKLYALYDFDRVAQTIVKKENAENVHNLLRAIKDKKQVVLKRYSSARSAEIRDRLVEPFDFSVNYVAVWCYDTESNENKLFKTTRIGNVEFTDVKWLYENSHRAGHMDVFRISSYDKLPIKLSLSLRAKNLLIEEYPLAEQYVSELKAGEYIFDGWVCSYDGIGRFVLGLAEEVEVVKTVSFKRYLNTKVKKMERLIYL